MPRISGSNFERGARRAMTEDAERLLVYIREQHGVFEFIAGLDWQLRTAQALELEPTVGRGTKDAFYEARLRAAPDEADERLRATTRTALAVLFENGKLYPTYGDKMTDKGYKLWQGFQIGRPARHSVAPMLAT